MIGQLKGVNTRRCLELGVSNLQRPQKLVSSSSVIYDINVVNSSNSASAVESHLWRFEPGVTFAALVAGNIRPRQRSTCVAKKDICRGPIDVSYDRPTV